MTTFGIFPLAELPEYKVTLSIKTKDQKLLKKLEKVEFKHARFNSVVLIPFVMTKAIKRVPTKENVVSEIVLEKILESLPELDKLVSVSFVKK